MCDYILDLRTFPGILLVLLMVCSDPGIGEKAGQFVIFFGNCV